MPKIHVSDCSAGPALDAAVALAQGLHIDNLAGYWKDDEGNNVHPACFGCDGVPTWHPSGDIRAAWLLFEELAVDYHIFVTNFYNKNVRTVNLRKQEWGPSEQLSVDGDKTPLAITRAYLLAHGVTEVEVPEGWGIRTISWIGKED